MNFKKLLPHVASLVIFMVAALLYFHPVLKGENITIKLNVPNSTVNYSEIHNEIGQKLLTIDNSNFSYQVIEMNFSAGIYFVKINYSDYLGDENYEIHKFIIH